MNEITIIEKEASPLVAKAEAIEIKTPMALDLAVGLLSDLNKFVDRITEEKEKVTKPLNEALKAERGRWKHLETAYEVAIALLRTKMTAYQTFKKNEAEKIAERVSNGKMKIETAVNKLATLDTPTSAKFREIKKFEVISLKDLPLEYHLANEVAIRKAMGEGVEIKGVRYFVEEVPVNVK